MVLAVLAASNHFTRLMFCQEGRIVQLLLIFFEFHPLSESLVSLWSLPRVKRFATAAGMEGRVKMVICVLEGR
jgi:hypothetical protein